MIRSSQSLSRRILASVTRRRLLSTRELAPIPEASGALVDFQTSAKIEGEETQVATITLQPGQTIRAESGSLVFMTSSIQMETSSSMSDGMKRFMTGQSLFVTDFTAKDTPGQVALAPAFPSKVLRINLEEYGELVCQKGAYVASNVGVNIDMAYAKNFSTGFFGGEGFVLQKLSGQGDVLLQASGALIRRDLQEGETLRVSSGTLVCFTNTIDYDVQIMPGFKNVMFGGEGLFVTTLRGPGTVWMQGMPPNRMISEIARRVPGGGIGFGVPIGMGGGGAADEAAGGEAVQGAEGGGVGGSSSATDEMGTASDAAINADRQATVATSGAIGTMDDDSSSSDALFGDAVPKEVPSSQSTPSDSFGQDTFGETSQEPSFDDSFDQGGFAEETSFSSEDTLKDFADDNSSFSSYGESSGSDLGDSISGSDVDTGGIVDTAKSVFSTIWDLFSGDD